MSVRIAFAALFVCSSVVASAGIGSKPAVAESNFRARFGTRDPTTCHSFKEPRSGPISAEQAKQYFKCAMEARGSSEATNGQVFVVEKLELQVDKATTLEMVNIPDAAPNTPVYPIKGSFVLYGCTAISTSPLTYNKGKNCTVKTQPNASGWCYKNVNGDWRCEMVDTRNRTVQMDLPPPAD